MKKKLGRVAVPLLLTTILLTVNVLASSDVKVSKNAGEYGKLYGTLYGGAGMNLLMKHVLQKNQLEIFM